MTQKGYISKVNVYKRYFIVTSLNDEEVVLFFEEMPDDKFIEGDLIEYEVVESKEFGKCALNPQKIGNNYFDELKILRLKEITDLQIGFLYTGRVKAVEGFGVFIKYKYSEGLLHISNIINTQIEGLTKKEKNRIQLILGKIFLKGREVLVTVDRKNDTQYSIIWDKNVEPNKQICRELNNHGLST